MVNGKKTLKDLLLKEFGNNYLSWFIQDYDENSWFVTIYQDDEYVRIPFKYINDVNNYWYLFIDLGDDNWAKVDSGYNSKNLWKAFLEWPFSDN